MSVPAWAAVITAFATVITALGGLVLALATWRTAERTRAIRNEATETRRIAASTESKVDATHVIVNQRFTDLQRFNEALVRALRTAGVDVPIDQSIGPPVGAVEEG